MYDILEKLAESFGEKEVELILLVLRSVGFSLRKDDPLALKELILRLQQKAGEADHCTNR
jgi:nucleolar MIF4G domain-containing protein 1